MKSPAQIAASIPVDVMAGEKDPCNFTLPQQPMHRCFLPRTARYTSFRPVTNPYDAQFEGVRCGVVAFTGLGVRDEVHSIEEVVCVCGRVLGLSGQSVADVTRYASSSLLPDTAADAPVSYADYIDGSDATADKPGTSQGQLACVMTQSGLCCCLSLQSCHPSRSLAHCGLCSNGVTWRPLRLTHWVCAQSLPFVSSALFSRLRMCSLLQRATLSTRLTRLWSLTHRTCCSLATRRNSGPVR